jgi:CRISPR/Cas system Type II protein with McrA/HNH and RuvC-like nuclease domain
MAHSKYLSGLNTEQWAQLQHRLHDRQKGRCFICDERIDFVLHKGQFDIDHIDPLIKDGLDSENNFALTHASCNRSKGASNLEVARRLAEFEKLQEQATKHVTDTRLQLGDRNCHVAHRGSRILRSPAFYFVPSISSRHVMQ